LCACSVVFEKIGSCPSAASIHRATRFAPPTSSLLASEGHRDPKRTLPARAEPRRLSRHFLHGSLWWAHLNGLPKLCSPPAGQVSTKAAPCSQHICASSETPFVRLRNRSSWYGESASAHSVGRDISDRSRLPIGFVILVAIVAIVACVARVTASHPGRHAMPHPAIRSTPWGDGRR
jgi:hypothetical protein